MSINTRCATATRVLGTGCVLLSFALVSQAETKYATKSVTPYLSPGVASTAPSPSNPPLTHADLISFMRDEHQFTPLQAAADPEPTGPALDLNGNESFPPVENRLSLRWRATDLGNRALDSYSDTGRKVRKGMFGESLADKIDLKLSSHPELKFKVDFD